MALLHKKHTIANLNEVKSEGKPNCFLSNLTRRLIYFLLRITYWSHWSGSHSGLTNFRWDVGWPWACKSCIRLLMYSGLKSLASIILRSLTLESIAKISCHIFNKSHGFYVKFNYFYLSNDNQLFIKIFPPFIRKAPNLYMKKPKFGCLTYGKSYKITLRQRKCCKGYVGFFDRKIFSFWRFSAFFGTFYQELFHS